MGPNEPLTEEEVKQLILSFWKLDEEKAHLVDLMEVAAPDLKIRAIYSQTWKVRRSPETGKPVVVLNHVDHMRYVDGYAPPESKRRVDPHVGHEM